VQTFIALGIGATMMGTLAPWLRGDLHLLAWFGVVTAVLAWLCWRGAHALTSAVAAEEPR
jgi:hypothetical protein